MEVLLDSKKITIAEVAVYIGTMIVKLAADQLGARADSIRKWLPRSAPA